MDAFKILVQHSTDGDILFRPKSGLTARNLMAELIEKHGGMLGYLVGVDRLEVTCESGATVTALKHAGAVSQAA